MTKKELIPFALLSLIIVVPIFFSGGRSDEVMPIIFALVVLFLASLKFEIGTVQAKPEQMLIFSFVLWSIVNTFFFSVSPYASFVTFLPIFIGYVLYTELSSQGVSEKFKKYFALVIVGGSLVSALWGLYGYVSPDFTLLRLSATFYQPNAFAGFLIIPIILSLWFSLFGGKLRPWGVITSIILVTSLLLSFSRGGIISTIFALGIFLIFVVRESFTQKKLIIKQLAVLLFIVLTAFASSYFLYWLKFYNQTLATNSVVNDSLMIPSDFERPEVGETGFRYRIEMIKSARVLMQEQPFTGFGLGTFGQEVSRVIKSPAYWGSDPHNLYLRICMELGVIGCVFFIVFILFIVVRQGRRLIYRKDDLLSASYFSGFLGILLHNGADIDFMFSANVILFFVVAAFLTVSREQKERQKFIFPALFFGTALLLVPVLFIYAGAYNFTLAKDALKEQKISDFEYRLNQALKFDPISPEIKIFGASLALDQGERGKALSLLLEAQKIHPNDTATQLLLGRTYRLLGNNIEAEKYFNKSIELSPYRDLEADVYLLGILRSQERLIEAKEVARAGIERFPDSLFKSVLWVDEERKSMVEFQKLLLGSFLE